MKASTCSICNNTVKEDNYAGHATKHQRQAAMELQVTGNYIPSDVVYTPIEFAVCEEWGCIEIGKHTVKSWSRDKFVCEAHYLKTTIKVIANYTDGGGYDWSEAQLGVSEDNKFWLRSGCGCSCNSIDEEDWIALRDMNQVHEAVDSLRLDDAYLAEKGQFIAKAQELVGMMTRGQQ